MSKCWRSCWRCWIILVRLHNKCNGLKESPFLLCDFKNRQVILGAWWCYVHCMFCIVLYSQKDPARGICLPKIPIDPLLLRNIEKRIGSPSSSAQISLPSHAELTFVSAVYWHCITMTKPNYHHWWQPFLIQQSLYSNTLVCTNDNTMKRMCNHCRISVVGVHSFLVSALFYQSC